MLERTFTPKRTVCKVTFSVPSEWAGSEVSLVGDFNDWDQSADKLKKKKDKWEITKRLKPENEYRFKYLVDGEEWKNDDSADAYIPNDFGTEDSVVEIGK
ncbi:glycoside hydrolase [Rhodohalobacter sp. SW132]|uniref:isoamylase early set domain-containing protein n=1 Tax=Rhodohalobacter sp. SW132 TaxID=2293433 RepID=UPI000E2321C9|nr:isoamylase early set domain-containing protein [Rhodohalobacter sp. SW132]REL24324.1 glycoside hydrolase [Rhodohalobacter sp. SW132]